MRRWLKEPLLHFILLGAAFFAIDALMSDRTLRAGDGEIVVSAGRVENLAALFGKTWQRPPTPAELRVLVDDFILEEALYREGVALGVDQDDTIIRRRVRQKMEFVVDDIIEQAAPNEADLEQWLAQHPEAHARPGRFRFRQVYLDPQQRGERLAAEAQRVLLELRAMQKTADPRALGDASLIEHAFADVSLQAVEATFGKDFADDLAAQPTGEWTGPLESAYGLHLVHIDARTEGERPPLGEVRAAVERDWAFAQREKATKRYQEGVLARYGVRIEWPIDRRAAQETAQQ